MSACKKQVLILIYISNLYQILNLNKPKHGYRVGICFLIKQNSIQYLYFLVIWTIFESTHLQKAKLHILENFH